MSVTVDIKGNSYCAGYTYGKYGENNNQGSMDIVIAKFDANGDLQWIKQVGSHSDVTPIDTSGTGLLGKTDESEECKDIVVDSNFNVYCSGYTNSQLGDECNVNCNDAFILKLKPDATLAWFKQIGKSQNSLPNSDHTPQTRFFETCNGIALDRNEDVYCAGYTFGQLGETRNGTNDIFMMKLSKEGSLVWLKQFGQETTTKNENVLDSDLEECNNLVIDSKNNLYCSGRTYSSFGEQDGNDALSQFDTFILKYNPDSSEINITQFGSITIPLENSSDKSENCLGLAIDKNDRVYCGGYTSGNFGEVGAVENVNDVLVIKLDENMSFNHINK